MYGNGSDVCRRCSGPEPGQTAHLRKGSQPPGKDGLFPPCSGLCPLAWLPVSALCSASQCNTEPPLPAFAWSFISVSDALTSGLAALKGLPLAGLPVPIE